MNTRRIVLAGMVAACLTAAGPAAAENVLRFTIGIGGAVTMDPHSRWNAIERPALQQVYETLLDIDSNLAIVPQLALDWKPLDPTTWQFGLRPAVTFHDGTPFTAEDVVFSIERARADTSWVKAFVSNIAAASAVDDHTGVENLQRLLRSFFASEQTAERRQIEQVAFTGSHSQTYIGHQQQQKNLKEARGCVRRQSAPQNQRHQKRSEDSKHGPGGRANEALETYLLQTNLKHDDGDAGGQSAGGS